MGKGLNEHPWSYNNRLINAGVDKRIVMGAPQAIWWYQAARKQRSRILSRQKRDPASIAIDGHFYSVCLVHAMTAAGIVADYTKAPALTRAISQFGEAVPDYKNVRNLLEHWDAYAKGKGFLQKNNVVPKKVVSGRKWSHDLLTGREEFTINVGPFSLPLQPSFDALRSVVRATLAVARDRVRARD